MKTWLLLILGLALAGAAALLLLSEPGAPADPITTPSDSAARLEAAGPAGAKAGSAPAAQEGSVVRSAAESGGVTEAGSGIGRWASEGPAAHVLARLVDPKGQPALGAEARPGASFSAEMWPGSTLAEPPPQDGAAKPPVAADSDGRVEIEVNAGEALVFEFGGEYWRSQQRSIQPLRAGETADFGEIALTPACRLAGTISGPDGAAVAGAEARLLVADEGMFWEGRPMLQQQSSDAEGRVVFDGVPLGRFRIEAEAIGLARGQIEAIEVNRAPGDESFDLRLVRGGELRGHVVDADRQPAAGAEVFLFRKESNGAYWGDHRPGFPDSEPDAVCAADGSFALSGLPEDGAAVTLGARSEGRAAGYLLNVTAGTTDATIVLPHALTVSGRVLRENDVPVAGAQVSLMQNNQWGWEEQKASASSDAEGRFTLSGFSAGEFRLTASAAGADAEIRPFQVDRAVEDLVLRIAPRPALRVRVADPDGKSIAGALVEVVTPGGASGLTQVLEIADGDVHSFSSQPHWSGNERTGEDGIAAFHGAPAGELLLTVRHPDWGRQTRSYAYNGGHAETTIALQRPAMLLVRVTDGVVGVRGVSVRLSESASGRETEEQRTDHLGRAYWGDLTPGTWQVIHSAGGDASGDFWGVIEMFDSPGGEKEQPVPAGEAVELFAGQCTEKEIVLRDLAVVTVRVLRGGSPAADVFVRVEAIQQDEGDVSWSGGGNGPSGLQTDGRGMVVLDPVSAGKHRLILRPSRSAPDTVQEIELLPGPQSVTAQLNGAEVRGVIRAPSGPVVGARISLEPWTPDAPDTSRTRHMTVISMMGSDGNFGIEFGDGSGNNTTASTDQDGEFLFRDVPEGQWVVKSRARGFAPWASLPFSVSGDRAVSLPEQTLLPGGEISGRDHNWQPTEPDTSFGFDWNSSIRLEDAAGNLISMSPAGENGEFRIADLKEGEYVLVRSDWRSEPIGISAGERVRVDIPVAVTENSEAE